MKQKNFKYILLKAAHACTYTIISFAVDIHKTTETSYSFLTLVKLYIKEKN